MAPLWILGLISLVSVSVICSVLSSSCSGATWFPLSITVIPISAFLSSLSISGVLEAQPASLFLASVYSTVVSLRSSNLPPRLISDFLCPSQLLPFFSLYGLLMARLWRFGFLFCSSVSSLSRASVLRPPSSSSPITLLPCVVVLLIGVLSLRGLTSASSSVPSSFVLCFMFYVLLLYLSDWISMVFVCVGLWIWNVCVWYCVYGSGVSSLVSACVSPRVSILPPHLSSPWSCLPFSLLLRHRLRSSSSPSFPSVAFISESPP